MSQPPFIFEENEVVYKYFLFSGIPQFITSGSLVPALIDVCWYALPILFLLTNERIYAILFSIVTLIYFLTYNVAAAHHYHGLVGLLIVTIPFWTKKEERFHFLWEAARYYWLYIFASAALWKISRGTVFYADQLSNILKSQQINLLLQHPDTFKAHIAQYLIANPSTAHLVLIVNVLLQLSFSIGFFTKKFDTYLFWLAIIFSIANYYVMGIASFELLILNFTLMNWERIVKIADNRFLKKALSLYN
ncbi:MAG: hypothetical protein V4615_11670 [Bacteroidota bacterium]